MKIWGHCPRKFSTLDIEVCILVHVEPDNLAVMQFVQYIS